MKAYEMQMLLWDDKAQKAIWQPIKCSGRTGYVYRYPNRECAKRILFTLYPAGTVTPKRVLEVDKEPNMNDPYDESSWGDHHKRFAGIK